MRGQAWRFELAGSALGRTLQPMSDPVRRANDAAAELVAKAAVSAGRDAASRAARQLIGDDEADASEATTKSRKWKIIAAVVLALCLVLGLIGLVLNYWLWFLAAGVLGLAGLFGYWRLRAKLAARREAKGIPEAAVEASAGAARAMASAEGVAKPAARRVDAEGAAEAERRAEAAREARRLEAERDARARAEAEATREQEVDDELAAMKARLGK
jgi:hypothetical protein